MSERNSPISPRSPQIFADADRRSEELFAFEGGEVCPAQPDHGGIVGDRGRLAAILATEC